MEKDGRTNNTTKKKMKAAITFTQKGINTIAS